MNSSALGSSCACWLLHFQGTSCDILISLPVSRLCFTYQGTVKLWSMDELKLNKTLRHHTGVCFFRAVCVLGC